MGPALEKGNAAGLPSEHHSVGAGRNPVPASAPAGCGIG